MNSVIYDQCHQDECRYAEFHRSHNNSPFGTCGSSTVVEPSPPILKVEGSSPPIEDVTFVTCGLYYKQVTIVIYDRNDIGLYYKTRDHHN